MGFLSSILPIGGAIIGGLLGGPAGAAAGAALTTALIAPRPATGVAAAPTVTPLDPGGIAGESFGSEPSIADLLNAQAAPIAQAITGGQHILPRGVLTPPIAQVTAPVNGTPLTIAGPIIRGVTAVGRALGTPAGQIAQGAATGVAGAGILAQQAQLRQQQAAQFAQLQALSARRGQVAARTALGVGLPPTPRILGEIDDIATLGGGMAGAFRQTVVQTIQRGTNVVIKQEIFRGAPFLMQHDIVVAKRVFRMATKLHGRLPRRSAKRRKPDTSSFEEFIKAQHFTQALPHP